MLNESGGAWAFADAVWPCFWSQGIWIWKLLSEVDQMLGTWDRKQAAPVCFSWTLMINKHRHGSFPWCARDAVPASGSYSALGLSSKGCSRRLFWRVVFLACLHSRPPSALYTLYLYRRTQTATSGCLSCSLGPRPSHHLQTWFQSHRPILLLQHCVSSTWPQLWTRGLVHKSLVVQLLFVFGDKFQNKCVK